MRTFLALVAIAGMFYLGIVHHVSCMTGAASFLLVLVVLSLCISDDREEECERGAGSDEGD